MRQLKIVVATFALALPLVACGSNGDEQGGSQDNELRNGSAPRPEKDWGEAGARGDDEGDHPHGHAAFPWSEGGAPDVGGGPGPSGHGGDCPNGHGPRGGGGGSGPSGEPGGGPAEPPEVN